MSAGREEFEAMADRFADLAFGLLHEGEEPDRAAHALLGAAGMLLSFYLSRGYRHDVDLEIVAVYQELLGDVVRMNMRTRLELRKQEARLQ